MFSFKEPLKSLVFCRLKPMESARLDNEMSLILMPLIKTFPSLALYIPAISDAAVDLPHPVLPIMPMVSPGLISKVRSFTDSSTLP